MEPNPSAQMNTPKEQAKPSSSAKPSMQKLYDANMLKYTIPSNISVTNIRHYELNYADQQSYVSTNSTEMVFRLNSTQGYVYAPNSYLRFNVLAQGATASDGFGLGFLNNDATSLFSRLLIEDKSGQELERIENVNMATRNCLPWKHPKDYRLQRQMAGMYTEQDQGETSVQKVVGSRYWK